MKIGIVGLGLMGGSIAKSLNQNHFIIAYDVDRDAIDYALSQKIIQAGDTNLENFFPRNQSNLFVLVSPINTTIHSILPKSNGSWHYSD